MQLVAPAGSLSTLRAAVNNGADAVYLGMPKFGARAKAENFDADALQKGVEYAHLFGTKVFVTLNTLIKDDETDAALAAAKFAYDSGVDAAIVQDIRFIKELKAALPDMPLHASTQMGIHNAEGAKAVLDMGIKRAVLSRETLPEDIVEIKKTGIEVEFFVQGALCICFSGNCYFSSLASSYSGNRGKCMQLCRKPYTFRGQKGYFLSAKDICLYDRLDELNKLGVDAIKIEGRMRSEAYVAQAVRVYKSSMPSDRAISSLKAVYNRGDYCHAYLDENSPFRVIYPKSQSNIGVSVGKIDRVTANTVTVNGFTPHVDDGFKIMRNGIELGGATVKNNKIVTNAKCMVGDELRRTADGRLAAELRKVSRTVDVDVSISIECGCRAVAKATAGEVTIERYSGSIVQSAKSMPINTQDVVRVFSKTSDMPISPKIDTEIIGETFLPISALNELRRTLYDDLIKALTKPPKRVAQPKFSFEIKPFIGSGVMLIVDGAQSVNAEILRAVDVLAISPKDYNNIPDIDTLGKPLLLDLPITMRGSDRAVIKAAVDMPRFDGVISNNLYTPYITDKPMILGTGHNIVGKIDLPHITSYEADCVGSGWTYVYGYAPMMTLCHCPYGNCINCDGSDMLIDEDGRKFRLRRYRLAHCYWQLLNCFPHYLSNIAADPTKNRVFDCRNCTADQILAILHGDSVGNYTRGNITKGLK